MAGWDMVMKFRDLLNNDQLILVACQDCGGRTPVDPAPLALELGIDADIARLAAHLRCPVCGSAEVELRAYSPVASLAAPREHAAEHS